MCCASAIAGMWRGCERETPAFEHLGENIAIQHT
jgi:hypothetical protein